METSRHLSELQRVFVPPPPLKESRPRDVRLTGSGRALFVLAICLFIGSAVTLVLLTREVRRQAVNRDALVSRSVVTTGTVTELWDDGDDRRRVRYRFEAEGRTFTDDVNVSSERRRTLKVGSPIEVRYVPGNPDVNDLGGRPGSGMPYPIPPLIAAVIAGTGVVCLLAIRVQRRLLENGRAAPAIVISHKTDRTQHGKHHSMTYNFPLLSGAVVNGKSGTSSKPPAIGSVITVIYDPDRPKRSRVYPFSLVKPS